ncbi:Rgg/GadR/MutR family transcriptional regulator [Lactococcus garvieae]|uniref:Rgg/GadR/MutR family transcriptional regulator n=3 Tax=Lactococcus garvieae TaxID=1363 RepID=UPI0023EAE9F3|nr:Rgg/GadR/MutR family transcriptional regulator [Lactococcus garvieae]
MVIKKYGKVFKDLRKQRGFKLTSFQDKGISPATVSNFENGKTKIAFDKLQKMLHTLSVTTDEYLAYTGESVNSQCSKQKELVHRITNAILTENNIELSKCRSYAIQLQEYSLNLALKGVQQPLSADEIGTLSEYLDNIKYWRSIDLYTLYISIDYLKLRQSMYILEGFFMEEQYYLPEMTFFHLSCRVIYALISSNNKENAKHFINYLSPQNYPHHTMCSRNLFNFINGYWKAKFGNYDEGMDDLQHALYIFEQLEKPKIYIYYKRIYDRCLQDISK